MILVDSSVWIDYFRGPSTREADLLDTLLARELLTLGDLILTADTYKNTYLTRT